MSARKAKLEADLAMIKKCRACEDDLIAQTVALEKEEKEKRDAKGAGKVEESGEKDEKDEKVDNWGGVD